jgi:hypothetical protein
LNSWIVGIANEQTIQLSNQQTKKGGTASNVSSLSGGAFFDFRFPIYDFRFGNTIAEQSEI